MIRAFLGTSLIDYPGRISSVVFIGGCNLHCPFCQNPELVLPDLLEDQYALSEDQVLASLEERSGFIEGVCITGGEPLLYPRIIELVRRIRDEMDLPVKLDTNGTLPDMLVELVPLLDYVSIDIKSSPVRYMEASGGRTGIEPVLKSVETVRRLECYELRSTMVPGLVTIEDLEAVLALTGRVRRYALQRFRGEKTLSPEFTGIPPYPRDYLEHAAERIQPLVDEVILRA